MRRWRLLVALAGAVALALGGSGCGGSGDPADASDPVGLNAILSGDVHVHSLMVDPAIPTRLWLGVHGGLYRSDDAGRSWRPNALEGEDAMNIASAAASDPLWVAGHEVLERSEDGQEPFAPVRPRGLPGLDLHGFAVRAGEPQRIVAALAGVGLFQSDDGGTSFRPLSEEVGSSVFGMSIARDGTLFAADPQQGLLMSQDGGARFSLPLGGPGLVGVAVDRGGSGLVVAGGEPGIFVSTDGGRRWRQSSSDIGVEAVAVSPDDPAKAYAVGVDAILYTSVDRGRSWAPAPASG